MPDPKAPNNIEPVSQPIETGNPDDSSKTRLGIGIVISVLANALLLQGAGVMAKNMSLNNPSPDSNGAITVTMRNATPLPSATPTPEATPSATPTPPQQKHHEKTPPTPKPRVRPTPEPTPDVVKPTPRPVPSEVPSVEPSVVPPSAITPPTPPPTPPPVAKIEQQQQQNAASTAAPALATTQVDRTATLQTHTPKLGNSSGAKAAAAASLANHTPSESNFKAPAIEVAPVQHVATLQQPSIGSRIAAIFSSSNAAAAPSANNAAVPEVITTDHTMTTTQAATHAGHISSPTARVAVIARTSASANTDFVLPTAEGTIAPGSHQKFQGNSGTSGTEAIAANSSGMIVNSSGPQVVVNAPGSTAITGPVGVYRPHAIANSRVAETLSDHNHGGAGGGTNTLAINAGTLGGGGNATGGHLSATSGGGTGVASFGSGAGHGSLQGGNGEFAVSGEGTGRTGSGRIASSGGPGRAIGTHAGTVGVGGRGGDGGAGDVGVKNGDVNGSGNGNGLHAGLASGGVEHGTGTTAGVGPASSGNGIGVANNQGGAHATTGPKATKTATEVGDTAIGKTHDVQYRSPTKPAIPESLKDKTFNTNVKIRVTFGADGQSRATIVKHAGAGLDALDDAALEACSHLRFTPAYQDGSPIDSTHEFNIEFRQ